MTCLKYRQPCIGSRDCNAAFRCKWCHIQQLGDTSGAQFQKTHELRQIANVTQQSDIAFNICLDIVWKEIRFGAYCDSSTISGVSKFMRKPRGSSTANWRLSKSSRDMYLKSLKRCRNKVDLPHWRVPVSVTTGNFVVIWRSFSSIVRFIMIKNLCKNINYILCFT